MDSDELSLESEDQMLWSEEEFAVGQSMKPLIESIFEQLKRMSVGTEHFLRNP